MALNPRSQEASTTPPRLRFNFTRAKEAGASDEQIVEFLRSKDTNIDWETLQERASKQQNPLAYQVATLAQNDWSFSQTPTPTHNPQAQNAQTTTPKAPEQNLASQPSGFSTTQSNKLAALEQENGVRSFWRQFAPEFLQSQSMQQDTKFLEDSTAQAIRANTPYDKLPKALQDHIASQPQEQSFGDDLATNLAPLAIAQQIHKLTNKSERAKHHYETQQKSLAIAQKEVENLSDEDKEFIKQQASAWDKLWDSDEELYHDFIQTQRASKVVPQEMKHAMEVLDNIHGHKDFFTLGSKLLGGEENKELKQDYLNAAHTIATNLGFDGIGTNEKGELFINHEGKYYRVESGFWESVPTLLAANTGSIAGSLAGAAQGARYGRALGGWGAVGGMALGGAIGAAGGGALDVVFANAYLNRETTAQEVIRHATQEGVLNLIADGAVLGAVKLWGKAKQIKPQALKHSLKQVADTAIEYTPLLGFAKRAKDGNKAAAQKLIDHAIPQEAQADLKALESIFGAEVQIGATKVSQAQSALNSLESKLGSDSYIVKGAKSLYDTFAFTSQKQAQKDFIRAIRADESGNLSAFLSEAANASPVIQKNLLEILNQTSQKLAHQLGRFDLPPSTIKDVFDNFEKGTKQSYTDAIEQILLKVYDESYTTTLAKDSPNIPNNLSSQEAARFNTDSLEAFKAKMEKSGVLLEDSAKFLRFVESTIYNPKGVTFETLNNAQKTLNAYYKQASDPNFRSFVKDAVNGFIKRDIQAGIEKIFAQNAPLYNDARTLFDTALSDYAKMKETLKLADSLKIRDRRRSYDQVAQSLSRFFLGQGDNIPNFEALLGGLQKELREQVELKLLQDMLELSFVKLNEIKVLDSSEFFKRLDPLKGYFASTSAKDFIKIAQDFHTLFRNDASIARSLSPATTEKIGTSIATTLEGAVKFQVIKAVFANIIRLMPHIPFAKGLNERVQGSALRYQLKKALDSSLSVGEFKLELQARSLKADFNNATREQIARILNETDATASPRILEREAEQNTPKPAQQVESNPLADFGQNFSEFRGQGAKAVEKILQERSGQVQGAFHRDDLGEIDVVWGDEKIGLQKIVEKHLNDFAKFDGNNPFEKLTNAINEIVESGKLISENGVDTLWHKKGDEYYLVGISKGFKGQGKNNWIITSYKKTKGKIPNEIKGDTANLSAYSDEFNPLLTSKDEPLNSSGNSTTLSPLEQALEQKQATKVAQEAAQAAQAAKDEATAQAIKDKNDQIQNLKDSRAGKGEMEREVQLGQPIAMKRTEQPPTSIATDDNNIYQLDFVIVKTHDVKPNFNADGLQPRTQKEHKTIESIAQNFKPEMVLGRGGYKDLPIIAKDGQVITGNHRVQGFKDFTQESRAAYEKAIKDRFNIELASDELLLRTPSDDLSIKELLSIAYNSNKEDIKNLGDHIYSVLGRYAPNFAKLPRQLESTSVQELKSKIARILDNSPYPDENGANLALLANTIKADKNANITEMLNAFSKLDKEDAARTLNTFTDTAGLWHILSNNAVEYGLKQLDLRPYLLGAMYKSAVSQHTTRAANFKELNAQIKHILDTTDTSGSNMMLAMTPNTYDNLIADLLGASLARFMRLENPSANLYEALKGANSGIREQLAPRLDFEIGFTTGRNIEQADIFDFIEYMIRQGDAGKEVNEAVELLPKLREKYEAFKGKDSALGRHSADLGDSRAVITDKVTPTPESPKNHESPTASPRILEREATPSLRADEIGAAIHKTNTQELTPQKVDSSDIIFTDKKGKEHTLTKEVQEQWLKTFNLKSLDETYTPKHSDEILQALGGKEIKLQLGSLKKLVAQSREKYIPQIKEVLDSPEAIMHDDMGEYLFIRHLKDDDYFVNVSFDNGEYLVSISNGIKETRNLNNKLEKGGSFIYQSPNFNSISQKLLQTSQYSANKIDSEIIPQPEQTKLEYESLLRELEKYNAIVKNNEAKGIDPYLLPNKEAKQAKEMQEALQEILSQTPQAKERAEQIAKEITQAYNDRLRTKIDVFNKLPTKTQSQEQKRLERLKEIEQIRDEILAPYRDEFAKFGWKAHDQLFVYPQAISKDGKEVILPIADDAQVLIGSHFEIYKLVPTLEKYARENPHNKQYANKLEQFRKHEQEYKQKLQQQEKLVQEHFSSTHHTNTPPKDTQTPAETQAPKVDSSDLQALRDNVEQTLESILHKDIQNTSTGITAQISRTSIKKMTSDKAIQKSLDNGFTKEQHFSAAQNIQELYKNAQHILTRGDDKNGDKAVILHEFISAIPNTEAAAKILVKESLDKDSRRIYTLELQELIPPLPHNPRTDGSKSGTHSKSLQESGAPLTPLENASADSTTKTFNQADIKLESLDDFASYARLAGFENLSQEQLESAHKHILANLEKLRC